MPDCHRSRTQLTPPFDGLSEFYAPPTNPKPHVHTEIPHEGAMADLVWSDPDSEKEDFAISPRYVDESDGPGSLSTARFSFSDSALDDRLAAIAPVQRRLAGGAGYTFGSGVVRKFLETNNMHHILRAHQLCMEGFTVLFDNRLSTVWSAPNYCYRCGNSASILEVGPGETMHFNVFEAAPENQTDGPSQQVVGGAAKCVDVGICVYPYVFASVGEGDFSREVRTRNLCPFLAFSRSLLDSMDPRDTTLPIVRSLALAHKLSIFYPATMSRIAYSSVARKSLHQYSLFCPEGSYKDKEKMDADAR
ncbi:phosphatase, partial [Rhizoctonia solani]